MSDSNIVTYLADKLTVDEIKTLVEFIKTNSKDSDILSDLSTIDSNVDNIITIINTINTNASTAANKSSSNATDIASVKTTVGTIDTNLTTANTNISSILSKVSNSSGGLSSCIKSIQRGTTTDKSGTALKISSVNTAKSIVLFTNNGVGTWESSNGNPRQGYTYLYSFTSTSITFHCSSYTTTSFDYQVIEFY